MMGSRRIEQECSLDYRSFGFAPLWAVSPGPEGPQSTTLGVRHCHSTGLGVLDEHRSGAEHFPGGQVWGYTYI